MYRKQDEVVKIMVIDDEEFFRNSLIAIISSAPNFTVVSAAGQGAQAIQLLSEVNVDVVLCDIRMPIMDGIEFMEEVKHRGFPCKVIAITSFNEDQFLLKMLHAGASGFLLKSAPASQIIDGIREALAGGTVISPTAASSIHQYLRPAIENEQESLSHREETIIKLLHQGKSNKEIAFRLDLSEVWIKKIMSRLMSKFKVDNRVELAIHTFELLRS